ncbi:zinc finger MYM-type protein 1-like [Athalia rosae]|uniref:zinc finger MYM-type protein 1-like n=1 Tax=Athalia rosae TaxID=37344 RepID=UPI0020336D19|nr:zinc finger MYM-type protein 1-like [Athalia rosae]
MERTKKSGWEYEKMRLVKEAALKKNKKVNAFFSENKKELTENGTTDNELATSCSIPDTIAILPLMKNPDLTCAKPLGMQPDILMDIENPKSSNANSEPVAKRIKLGASISGSADCVPGDVGAIHDVIFSDPSKWPFITDRKIRQLIVEKGPVQIEDFDFPVENGQWPTNGSSDWKHISRDLASHEKSVKHFTAFKNWREFHHRLRTENTVDREHERVLNREIEHWRNVLQRIISIIQYLATQSLALRDCTPDKSRIEQMSIIIRFVSYDEKAKKFEIRKHFLGFLPITDTTGKGLTEVILDELQNLGIAFSDMRGQGYDNGANMKGKHSGVQNRILWDVLKKHIPSLTLKAVSDTRWESRVDAIKPMRYQLGEIYDALVEISLDEKNNNALKYEAKCLAQSIANFKFICCVIIWFDIPNKVNVASKLLQNPALNIVECCSILDKTIDFLKQYRSEESFSRILHEARDLASEVEIETVFPPGNTVRVRGKKRNFEYEARDEFVHNPEKQFRIEFLYHVVDTAVVSIGKRFQQLQVHSNDFKFSYDIHAPKSSMKEEIMKSCEDLQITLSDGDHMDIDGIDLCDELINLALILPGNQSPIEVLNYLVKNDLLSIVSNVVIALRTLLSLPVSVASRERSFSKLKFFLNYLRSTMSQERLVGLATISIESELCDLIDYQELIADFAKVKARKISFE